MDWEREVRTIEKEILNLGEYRISTFRHDANSAWRWTASERDRFGEYAPKRRGAAKSALDAKREALTASNELGWLTAHQLAELLSSLG